MPLPESVGIIIPAYNEENRIGSTIKALKKINCIDTILVVDDGSSDATCDVVQQAGGQVLKLNKNSGKGNALRKGLEEMQHSIIAFVDADIGETAVEIEKLILPVLKNHADVTIGKIPFELGKGGFGVVKKFSRFALKQLTGVELESVLSGQRCFRRSVMDPKFLKYNRFGIEFGMTVDLINNDIRVMEVPIKIQHRVTGKDIKGFIHRGYQFLDILTVYLSKALLKY
jgi:glycosyltransferase involved in cell wall biosynthesis